MHDLIDSHGFDNGQLDPRGGRCILGCCQQCLVSPSVLCLRRRSKGDRFYWWCSGYRQHCCRWCSSHSRQEDPTSLLDCTAEGIDCQ
uniref:Uncharacterized protein n=1 Tax=Romanomermis culicivorax TaxID=13658 RepID=A0A915JQ09_ROMCU